MKKTMYSRRDVLRTTAGAMGVGLLAACAAPDGARQRKCGHTQ